LRLNLRGWAKYPDGGRFAGIGATGDEKPVDFGNKQRGSRTGYRRDVCSPPVCISLRLEHIQISIPTAEVHALTLCIDEEIVGITTRIDGCNGTAVRHGEDAKLSGIPKRHENSPGIFVQSHWEIAAILDRPTRYLFAGETVEDRDLACLRDVHEDASGRAGELKTFGMSLQLNLGDLAIRRRVDYASAPLP
jgi:hypothetical protein